MQQKLERGDSIMPLDWLKNIPHEAAASSSQRGWVGLEAARYRAAPASEYNPPAITHHWFVLFIRPPEEMDLRCETVNRHVPPPADAIVLVPAGTPAQWRWSGLRDTLHGYLELWLVTRAAPDALDLRPPRPTR